MCKFFSFVTDPINHQAEYYYFDWDYRKANLGDEGMDSHSHICTHFNLNEDICNKYEFNPLTGEFEIDQINSERDDSEAAEKWANRLDFKTVVEPLIVKPVVNPFKLTEVTEVTAEHIQWLHDIALVRDSIFDSIMTSIENWAFASVMDSVWASVMDLVRASYVSVWAYASSFFAIEYQHDYSSAVKLWEAGLVLSFDGEVWRLHTGMDAHVVYEESEK